MSDHAYCALRATQPVVGGPAVWEVLNDSAHTPFNIDRVVQDSKAKTLTAYFKTPLSTVTAPACGPDETYLKWGYWIGASVALDRVVFTITHDTDPVPRPAIDPASPALVIPWSNFWFRIASVATSPPPLP